MATHIWELAGTWPMKKSFFLTTKDLPVTIISLLGTMICLSMKHQWRRILPWKSAERAILSPFLKPHLEIGWSRKKDIYLWGLIITGGQECDLQVNWPVVWWTIWPWLCCVSYRPGDGLYWHCSGYYLLPEWSYLNWGWGGCAKSIYYYLRSCLIQLCRLYWESFG